MALLIGFLVVVMVLVCLFLVLLVLMQLPKKDAGAGLAFGGAATDALFGAGSGNFLTKATKYAASVFFILAVVLSVLQSRFYHRTGSEFRRLLEQPQNQPAAPVSASAPGEALPGAPAPSAPAAAAPVTNLLSVPLVSGPAAAATNPAPASP
jgi:preprotein translocase subunit SecG